MRFLAALVVILALPARAEEPAPSASSTIAAPPELIDLVRGLPQPANARAFPATAGGMPILYRIGAEALRDRPALKAKAKPVFDQYLREAEAGDRVARASLARLYLEGTGTARSELQSFHWMQLAAQDGEVTAESSVAHMYFQALGVPRNDAEALRWANIAAEHGDPSAWNLLGVMYMSGRAGPVDAQKALHWILKGVEAGDAYSMLNLADYTRLGRAVPRDPQRAMELKMKAISIFRTTAGGDAGAVTEDARRYLVQAQAAIRDKQFLEARDHLQRAMNVAPWSPLVYYNMALVQAELNFHEVAIWNMETFLALSPDAPQARGAQDLIYEWERKVKK